MHLHDKKHFRISVIGTVHAENGCANVAALQSILNRIQPEVIFAEIDSENLASYIKGSHGNLESEAVAFYREHRPVNVIPVDSKQPSSEFLKKSREMFNKVERTSSVYRHLVDQHSLDTRNHGFSYLNSAHCEHAWTYIFREVFETIEWIGEPNLQLIYKSWREINEQRESVMFENISKHIVNSEATQGVLLVGAAHRKALIDRIQKLHDSEDTRVIWNRENPLDPQGIEISDSSKHPQT